MDPTSCETRRDDRYHDEAKEGEKESDENEQDYDDETFEKDDSIDLEVEEMSSATGSNMSKDITWRVLNRHELTRGERIGGGGVGLVYAGTYQGHPVAIKALFDPRHHPTLDDPPATSSTSSCAVSDAFMDELWSLARVSSHPHVITLVGAIVSPPQNACLVMERGERSLFELLHETSMPLSLHYKMTLACDIASAMAYCHAQCPTLIHRDLKSPNVLLVQGNAKLCDFGLVRTRGLEAGTPCYMAPEQFRGHGFSAAVDVYMFAILLWELVTQHLPFAYDTCQEIKHKVLAGQRPLLPTLEVPPALRQLIITCWQDDPSARLSFHAIETQLTVLLSELPLHSQLIECDAKYGGDALDRLLQ